MDTELQQMASPAMSNFSDMDDEELELYLAGCGRLSNLPTPPRHVEQAPAAFKPSPPALSTPPPEQDISHELAEIHAYATHLVGLVPSGTDTDTDTDTDMGDDQDNVVDIVQGFLRRAMLPVEVVAFAACLLQRLSLVQETSDLLILSSLALAHGYLNDRARSNAHWAILEASGRYDAGEIQRAKMKILIDIDFGLFRISEEAVNNMVAAMQRHLPALVATSTPHVDATEDECQPRLTLATGTPRQAVWCHGVPTPEPSP